MGNDVGEGRRCHRGVAGKKTSSRFESTCEKGSAVAVLVTTRAHAFTMFDVQLEVECCPEIIGEAAIALAFSRPLFETQPRPNPSAFDCPVPIVIRAH